MNGVTIEQMIGAVDEQVSGLRQMVQRPDHDVPQYWTDLFYCLNTTSAFLRKIAEPSDDDVKKMIDAAQFEDAVDHLRDTYTIDEDHLPVCIRAALATLHQTEIKQEDKP